MITVFSFLGSIFGYVLYGCNFLVQNFGVAIIIFTIIFKIILFPMSIKQQKSMAANARIQAKQKELQEQYKNNKQKYNEELQKLYDKENMSPMSGCLTSLLPMFVMLGIYYAVVMPITNVLHIAKETYSALALFINQIPGVSINSSSIYSQIDVIRLFNNPGSYQMLVNSKEVTSILSPDQISSIKNLSGGFNFLGLDLLSTPKNAGIISWAMLIPVLCLVTSLGSQFLMQRMNGNPMGGQQGCMKYMLYLFPLLTAWIAYSVPCAVGFYWICSTVLGFIQSLIMSKIYSPAQLTAKAEAQHIALMKLQEANVPYSPVAGTLTSNTSNQNKKSK